MGARRVYLGLLDIDLQGRLDLQTRKGEAAPAEIARYLFSYGLIASDVCMQGSAPLKSAGVFLAYTRLAEAFQRNEAHQEKDPVFSFVLSSEPESYLGYLAERLSFLRGKGDFNTERQAYLGNDGLNAARQLDKVIDIGTVRKRTKSVSGEYKSTLLFAFKSGNAEELKIPDAVAKQAIAILNDEEIIQTHFLLTSLKLSEQEQINAVYRAARERYRKANAYGSEAIDSESKAHFQWRNVWAYLGLLGMSGLLSKESALNATLLFKLRALPSFKAMNDYYFECQDQEDIDALLKLLHQLQVNGKLRSLLKQSPGAAVAFFFETLNQAEIGYKSVNKGLEQLAKIFLLDVADEVFAKKIYAIHASAEALRKDLAALKVI